MIVAHLIEEIQDLVIQIDQREMDEEKVAQLYEATEEELIQTKQVLLLSISTEALYPTFDELY